MKSLPLHSLRFTSLLAFVIKHSESKPASKLVGDYRVQEPRIIHALERHYCTNTQGLDHDGSNNVLASYEG